MLIINGRELELALKERNWIAELRMKKDDFKIQIAVFCKNTC
jgi:hypothetical protein